MPAYGHRHVNAQLQLTLLALSALPVMANATIAPSLPGLYDTFSSLPGIDMLSGLVLTLPSLSVVLFAGSLGRLADRLPTRPFLVTLLLIYAIAGVAGAFVHSLTGLLASRLLLGLGVAGSMTLATLLVGRYLDAPRRARFVGWQTAMMALSSMAFVLLAGWLAQYSWRAPFFIYLLALPVALLAVLVLPLEPSSDTDARPHSPSPTLPTGDDIPWAPLRRVAALSFIGMLAFYLVPTRLPFLMRHIDLPSPLLSGTAIAVTMAVSMVPGLLFARISTRFDGLQIYGASFLASALGLLVLASAHSLGAVFGGCVLMGAGLGLLIPNHLSEVIRHSPESHRGRIAGILTAIVFLGQLCSPILSGLLCRSVGDDRCFVVAGLAMLLLSARLLWLRPRGAESPLIPRTKIRG